MTLNSLTVPSFIPQTKAANDSIRNSVFIIRFKLRHLTRQFKMSNVNLNDKCQRQHKMCKRHTANVNVKSHARHVHSFQ